MRFLLMLVLMLYKKKMLLRLLRAMRKKVNLLYMLQKLLKTNIHLNSILNNYLNSSNYPLMTKSPTPTPPQSPKPSITNEEISR